MLVWSVGEVLWDVFPDQERLGGAPLNVCANLQRLGDRGVLLSAVGTDERGRLALNSMRSLGLSTEYVCEVGELPTGTAAIRAAVDGETEYEIPRRAAFDLVSSDPRSLEEAAAATVDWLYFGTLLQTELANEAFIAELTNRLMPARVFYDMNLRTGHWNLELVQRLSRQATVLKLNEQEAETLFHMTQKVGDKFTLEGFCRTWASDYSIDVICVTLGPEGCMVYDEGTAFRVPGYKVTVCDTVGSGDAFAAAFLHGYYAGWPILKTARFANALGALVASRAGATPQWTFDEVIAIIEARPPSIPAAPPRRPLD